MTWNRENMVSLASSVRAARECARAIRDQLSLELWEEVNELYLWLGRESTETMYWENREDFYRHVRRTTQLILGLVRSTMLHGEPMRFLWLGVMLERGGQTARMLDMHHHTMMREAAHDIVRMALWMSLLRACSGAEGFMKKHQGRVSAQSMLEFTNADDPGFDAFAALLGELNVSKEQLLADKPLLVEVLTYHVVPGEVLRAEVPIGSPITTVQGDTFTVDGNLVVTDQRNRSARIVDTDLRARNGVIHAIDRVILPAP